MQSSPSANASNAPSTDPHDDPPRAYTLAELQGPVDRRGQLRRVPKLCLDALRLVWAASPKQLLTTLLLQVLSGAAVGLQLLIGQKLLRSLIDLNASGGSLASLAPEFGLLVGVILALGATGALIAHQQRLLVELVGRYTFDRIIRVSASVELQLFETAEFYDQLQRARTSGTQRSVDVVNSVSSLTTALLTSIGIAVVLAILEPLLLVLVVVAAIPVLFATVHNSRAAYTFEYSLTPESRERMYLMELLTGRQTAKEVRVFGAEEFLRRRYEALTEERLRRLREFLRRRLTVALIGTGAGVLGTAVALGALGVLVVRGRIDVATALITGVAMQQLGSRLAGITGNAGRLIESGMFIDDFNTFLHVAPPTPSPRSDVRRPSGSLQASRTRRFESLEVEGVTFSYPNTDMVVLDDVSLRVRAGEIVALVGENGSGKTTLVKLICQLYRPDLGRILWNGFDTDVSSEEVRDDTTVLFQDFIQYHLSVSDNIALGRVERAAELAEIIGAARKAGADAFLSKLPNGYETRLGRQFYGGHELSIGQWQRLALARAFFRDGSFLVLDEPTASLDPRAEHALFEQMRRLSKGRSVLLVSHRFSSVRSADRIYVIKQGRLTESGSHDDLMSLDGHYAELFNLQAAAYLGEGRSS